MGTLKTSTKLVGASLLMGAGAELAGHISSKAQDAEEGSQVIRIEDWGPSIARFDSVDATTDGSRAPHWTLGTRNPLTFRIPVFFFALFLVILFRCCLRRLGCIAGMCGECTHPEKPHTPPATAPSSCETTLDMEAEMESLDKETHNPSEELVENQYAIPHRHLQEVIKQVNESVVNRAQAAHLKDTLHQRQQEETE